MNEIVLMLMSWIENYYNNDYLFDGNCFQIIIGKMAQENEIITNKEIMNLIGVVLDIYERRDYYQVVEVIEYELLPLLSNKKNL